MRGYKLATNGQNFIKRNLA